MLLAAYTVPVGTVLPTNVKMTMASTGASLAGSIALGSIAGGLVNNAQASSSQSATMHLNASGEN